MYTTTTAGDTLQAINMLLLNRRVILYMYVRVEVIFSLIRVPPPPEIL